MATPENTFIGSVHRHLPVGLYRQKNHNAYRGGEPDCWYSGNAGDLWVEYKFVVIPKRPDTPVKIELSELQKNWLRARSEEGRNVAVIVGSKTGGVWLPSTTWKLPLTAKDYTTNILSRPELAAIIENLTS